MRKVKELFDDIILLANMIEDNGIDTYRIQKGIEEEKIKEWEENNAVKLPVGYKEFIVLANGFSYGTTQILPLERIDVIEVPEEFKGFYMIGSYIGDGSLILSDKIGNFYYGDHAFGLECVDFLKFLEDDILRYMKDDLKDNNISIPENLNTRETK